MQNDQNTSQEAAEVQDGKSRRGFASMDQDRQREIASQGGKAAHEQGKAHEWSSQEAAAAGKKGGQNSHGGGRPSRSEDADQEKDMMGSWPSDRLE